MYNILDVSVKEIGKGPVKAVFYGIMNIIEMKKSAVLTFLLLCSAGFAAENCYVTSQISPVSSFARDSIAFLNAAEYPVNAKRTKDVLLVSSSDGAFVRGKAADGGDVIPYCLISGVMYGRGSSDYKVYQSLDGNTWTRTAYATVLDGCLFGTVNNNLIAVNNGTRKIYRSTDGGDSFAEVYTCPHPTSQWTIWSYAKNSTTMMLCDYGGSGGFPDSNIPDGRYVHKSVDDGANWEVCLDGNSLTDKMRHWHTVGYHAGSGRWLAYAGDLMTYNKVMYSTDEGANWDYLYAAKNCFVKPVSVVDYGSPTDVLFGDDLYSGISALNVVTGEVRPLGPQFDGRDAKGYVFCVAYYDGIYYGCTYNLSWGSLDSVIYVSNDLINWSVYHRFDISGYIRGVFGFVGYLGGKLHFQVMSAATGLKQFAISPAKVTLVSGSVIMPAVTNLLNTANLSSFETSAALSSASLNWKVSRTTDEHYHGTACMKCTGIDNDIYEGKKVTTANISLTGGKTYIVSFAIKGTANGSGYVHLYRNFDPVGWVSEWNDVSFPISTTWREVKTFPYTIVDSGNYRIYIGVFQGPVAQTVYIDSLQIAEYPVKEWQIGGTNSVCDILTATVTTPAEWTDVFIVQTTGLSPLYKAASNLYIKTWKADANNFMSLYYNPTVSKFYIQRTIDGSALAAVGTTTQFWQPNAILKFAFQSCPAGISLSVQNGKAFVETITNGAMAAINSAAITMINGDVNSANQFPGVYVDKCAFTDFVPVWLSSKDIESLFNLTQPINSGFPVYPKDGETDVPVDSDLIWVVNDANLVGFDVYFGVDELSVTAASRLPGDINGDGEVDYGDVEEFANQWLMGPPCGPLKSSDLNYDCDVDFSDFALIAGNFGAAGDGVYKGHFTGDTDTYEPGTMSASTEYYWRVDGIDRECNIVRGPVCKFTTR